MNDNMDVVFADDTQRIIKKLIKILGRSNIDSSIKEYKECLKHSGDFYRKFHLERKHLLFDLFDCIFELERKWKTIKNHAGDHKISKLSGYAKSIVTIIDIMPESVKAKFAKDLTDTKHWANYLFEIESAWQFRRREGLIAWHEKENSPDFTINFPEIEFDVECKRITVDAERKVHQKDFYRLSDKLIPKLADKYKWSIAIELDGRLSSDDQELNKMSCQIEKIISTNKVGCYDINRSAKVFLDLQSADGRGVDSIILNKIKEYSDLKTFYTVFAKNEMNPICLAVKSKKSDDVLGYIKDRMKDATKKQLKPDRPGLLFFFLRVFLIFN